MKPLLDKVVDHVRLDIQAPVADVLKVSLEAMKRLNERTDREKVDVAVGAYRAGGLGIVGAEETLAALIKGQVDELLITGTVGQIQTVAPGGTGPTPEAVLEAPAIEAVAAGEPAEAEPHSVRLANELITKATQTGARITFVEDPSLLADYGGVAALLRFTI